MAAVGMVKMIMRAFREAIRMNYVNLANRLIKDNNKFSLLLDNMACAAVRCDTNKSFL